MGRVFLTGGKVEMGIPLSGILASELAVGSSVYLNENGNPVEYLIVNKGIPSNSNLYDSSCNGIWLLRKDIYETRQWHTSNVNSYKDSTIHAYLNSDFLNLFGDTEKKAIKQVKIPHVNGTSTSAIASGSNGLATKVFLLGGYELGYTTSTDSYFPEDGACLSYFSVASYDAKRVAYFNGAITAWWLRSAYVKNSLSAWGVYHLDDGRCGFYTTSPNSIGVRPALILPSNAVFDEATLVLKGA